MSFDILQGFLNTEIVSVNTPEHQEMYDAIHCFLSSFEIREGKFETNEYLIHKISRDTAILYQEYEMPDGWEYSETAKIIRIKDLLSKIDTVAINEGLSVRSRQL